MTSNHLRDDRVYLSTRLLAVVVVPFLVVAFVILDLFSTRTGELFAWPIQPAMTAMMLGAAYLGGIYFFTWSNFDPASLTTWLFIGGLSGLLIGIVILYVVLEKKRKHED